MGRRALIAGATGLTGSRLLPLLLAEPAYELVHAVLRRPLPDALRPADPASAARLHAHVIDFEALGRGADLPEVDDVYLCLGTTIRVAGSQAASRRVDFAAVVGIARLARRRGASRCAVVSALGADASSRGFYPRVKGEAEAALAALDYPSLTVLRPSLIDGERPERRTGEGLWLGVARPLSPLLPPRWRPVTADAIARCMLAAVLRGEPGLRVVESDRIPRGAG
ncbi:MAG TPA: NAD(P)H-binding protein [Burkholderiaceae bacterium]|nr:NAD(P)H-binding protein [Burkholderiaceae bacterium]